MISNEISGLGVIRSTGSGAARPIAIANWLIAVAVIVVLMIVIGGITRLTESGLSITEWRPVTGAVPPLNAADWQAEFARYQRTTEFQTVNASMTLAAFKAIYFWEWLHRLIGRVIGLAFALPLAWFALRRAIPPDYGWRLVALLALGGLQGAIGWWMVTSGLVGRTDVSHYRLAVHLMLAFLILGALVWTVCDLRTLARDATTRPARLKPVIAALLGVFALQLVWGAFTAGLDAGFASADWPQMSSSSWVPGSTVNGIRAAIDTPDWVQFVHRWWAWATAGALVMLAIKAIHAGQARRPAIALKLLVALQIMLGIATVLSGVALWIAVAHQLVAALLVWFAAQCAHQASVAP